MGYLSQIVQDARPRATPSLYAQTGAVPQAAAVPLRYARLMESAPADVETQQRALEVSTPEGKGEMPETEDAPQEARPVRPQSQTPRRVEAARPDVSDPVPPAAPASFPKAQGQGATTHPSPKAPPTQTTPSVTPAKVSGAHPRPASFEVPVEAKTAPTPFQARPSAERTDASSQIDADAPAADDPLELSPTISPRVAVAAQKPQSTSGIKPNPSPAHPYDSVPDNAGRAPQHPIIAPAPSSGPAEVHIGEVEIIVQEPPVPRAAPARRTANTAPSPARYHIRRL